MLPPYANTASDGRDWSQLLVWPIAVGGGKPGLPTGVRTNLELLDERRFRTGVVYLRYHSLGQ